MPKKWGSVARRGGRVVAGEEWRGPPEGEERPAGPRPRAPEAAKRAPARAPAARESQRARPASRRSSRLPAEVVREVHRAGGRRGETMADRLGQATEAYAKDRYQEARSILRPLAHELPAVASVRELYGLVLYRMGSWKAALKELQEAATLGGSVDQHPVIADCYRALGRHRKVEQTWDELRRGGASAEVMAEGRLVRAGDLADQGKLPEAIELLETAAGRELRRPRLDHLRQWYALGDLYERSGDIPRARSYFLRVAGHDPEYADIEHRLRSLK